MAAPEGLATGPQGAKDGSGLSQSENRASPNKTGQPSESEQRYRLVSDLTSDFAYAFRVAPDSTLTREWVTEAFTRITDFRPEEVNAPLDWAEIVYPDDKAIVQRRKQALLAGNPDTSVFRIITKNGEVRWLRDRSRPEWDDAHRQVVRIYGAAQDITDHKLAEEALRKAHQALTFHVENSPLAVIEWDNKFQLQRWSKRAEEMFGWKAEEVLGQHTQNLPLVYTEDVAAVDKVRAGLLDGSKPRSVNRNRNFTKDKSIIYCEWYESALFDSSGQLVSILSLVQDITERRQAEDAFQYRLEFEALITNISTNFINLPIDKIDPGINQALAMIGKFVGVDICFVFLPSEDRTRVSITHSWRAGGIESRIDKLRNLPIEDFPWMVTKLSQFQTVYVPSVADMPAELRVEQKFLEAQGVKSLIQVPMVHREVLRGMLGFASVRVNKTWSEDIISLLKIVSEIFVNALRRKVIDQELKARARQQAAVARLSQRGLAGLDLPVLLDEAATIVAETLEIEYSEVLELLPEEQLFLLRAGTGWSKRHLGRKYAAAETGSMAEYTLQASGPVIVVDFGTETRFRIPLLFRGYKIVSSASVIIYGQDQPFGILGAHTTSRRNFNEDDIHFFQAVANVLGMVIERLQAEAKIQASLREKEVLLLEIHHRVKNNLQVVSSLLRLQARQIQNDQSLEMFRDSQNRIKSMALIHEKLYNTQDLARIDFSKYVSKLGAYLFQSYSVNPAAIELALNIDDISLDIDTAVSCGLIISELVSNSLKYAFPPLLTGAGEPPGKIRIGLRAVDNNQLALTVSDNGCGLPKDFDLYSVDSLGLQLVKRLTQQLKGKIELDRSGGTTFTITFTGKVKK